MRGTFTAYCCDGFNGQATSPRHGQLSSGRCAVSKVLACATILFLLFPLFVESHDYMEATCINYLEVDDRISKKLNSYRTIDEFRNEVITEYSKIYRGPKSENRTIMEDLLHRDRKECPLHSFGDYFALIKQLELNEQHQKVKAEIDRKQMELLRQSEEKAQQEYLRRKREKEQRDRQQMREMEATHERRRREADAAFRRQQQKDKAAYQELRRKLESRP